MGGRRSGSARAPASSSGSSSAPRGGSAAISVILRVLWQIYRSTSGTGSPSDWPASSMSRRRSQGRLEALGPVGGRDVLLLDGADGIRARQLTELGARVPFAKADGPAGFDAPDASADVVVSLWTSFRDRFTADVAAATTGPAAGRRAPRRPRLRPRRRVAPAWRPPRVRAVEPARWPFLRGGFKVRVVHAFWTFESLEDAARVPRGRRSGRSDGRWPPG